MPLVNLIKIVKISRVNLRLNKGNLWSSLSPDPLPIDSPKKGMIFDLLGSILTESRLWSRDESYQQVSCLIGDLIIRRDLKVLLILHDLFTGDGRILPSKGRITHEHLEHDRPKRPPVDTLSVAVLGEDLRGDIVDGSHHGVDSLSGIGAASGSALLVREALSLDIGAHFEGLAESKVGQF